MYRIGLGVLLAALLAVITPTTADAQVSGTVREEVTGVPIAGAIVTVRGTTTQTTTDAVGNFSLPTVMGTQLHIVAAKRGYYHQRPPGPTFTITTPATGVIYELEPLGALNDPNYVWKANNECGICHNDQEGSYSGSPMNMTGQNLWVYDVYSGNGTPGGMGGFVYINDSAHRLTDPDSDCASCHQPEHWISSNLSSVALSDINNPSADAGDGVSCEICHKIRDVDVAANAAGFDASVDISRPNTAPGSRQVMYGPLGDVSYQIPDFMYPSYNPTIETESCAVCHQYNSDPDNDGDHNEPGSFPGQTTFSEWAASPYGDPMNALYQTCADCHMPAAAAPNDNACTIDPVTRPVGQVRSHDIRGTSAAFLESAATMAVTAQVVGTDLQVSVDVTNSAAGHDLPTGINLRSMILLVEATRDSDSLPLASTGAQTVGPEGGVGDPALGYFSGLPGKIYGRFLEDALGGGPVPFTDAVAERFNTRIAPLMTDTTSYTFAAPPGGGDVTVRARLIYRRAWRSVIDAKGWTTTGTGGVLEDIVAPHFGHLMEDETATASFMVVGQEFVRGDCNADGAYNIADAVRLLNFLFPAMPPAPALDCEDACDCNDDGTNNIADAVCMLNGLFGGVTVPPAAPHPGCGLDPTADSLTCDTFPCP